MDVWTGEAGSLLVVDFMSEVVDRELIFGQQGSAIERIAPEFFDKAVVDEHIVRYHWAAKKITGKRVLDIACGTGYGNQILERARPFSIDSVDISWDALSFGRKRYELSAIMADAIRLPFLEANFDVVVSLETIEHVADPDAFLNEVARVLRPGGQLAISTPNVEISQNLNPYHIQEWSLEELCSLLTASGFRDPLVWGQGWRVRGHVFRSIPGLRRVAWEIERRPAVTRFGSRVAFPRYWCVQARRAG